ncbi:putative CRISPR-associated protein [Thermotoga sp. KOL6]|uniref:putative CRISPR-associated protein n=1 Tax=Thermotoga sp. KOL6 TaxID=126741 RepID=UPI000C76FACC|nr:putative CRISPR-associated protein [Thermotoga sp. KOL6]PLV58064.1 hypothetical protein AS005_08625 [Thermotoga sp. KOL6]
MKDSVICTVGASLLGNIMKGSLGEEAKRFYENNNLHDLAKLLLRRNDPLNDRSLGAEINSMTSLVERGIVDFRENLFLFVSDTEEGAKIGEVLKIYFLENKHGVDFKNVQVVRIEGLKDSDEHEFKTKGLRNLVREMAKYSNQNLNRIVINATGGYKAQIAYAVALGQALKIPVCYRFERFNHMVTLPPLPITLDQEIYRKNKRVFALLDAAFDLELKDFLKMSGYRSWGEIDESLKMFLDRVHVDGKDLVALNPIALIYLESVEWDYSVIDDPIFYSQNPPEEKLVGFEIHGQKAVRKSEKIIEEISKLPWIDRLHLTGSSERHTGNGFKVSRSKDSVKIEITTEKGTLYMKAYCKYYSERFLDAVARKIEEKLREILQ